MLRLFSLASGLLTVPAAFAHPGHEHAQGWLARWSHSTLGWDPLLILFAVAAVALCLSVWHGTR